MTPNRLPFDTVAGAFRAVLSQYAVTQEEVVFCGEVGRRVTSPTVTMARLAFALRMLRAGATRTQIAERLGCSVRHVRRWSRDWVARGLIKDPLGRHSAR